MVKVSNRELHQLLKYTEEERQEIRKEYGLKDDILLSEIDAITDWFYKQPHLADAGIEPDIIECMLVVAKGSREKAKKKIDEYYKGKTTSPDIFQGRDEILNRDFYTFSRLIAIPRLHNLERIIIVDFINSDPSNFQYIDLIRNAYLVADFRIKYDYLLGDRWVIDFAGLGNNILYFLPKINLMLMQRSIHIFQEGLGTRIFGIHVLNVPATARHLVSLFNQFVKPKIMERVIFHESLEELYEHIGKDYLPKDYGGTQKSMAEFADSWQTELRKPDVRQYLIDAANKKSDENERPGEKTVDPLAGSFKKLDLD